MCKGYSNRERLDTEQKDQLWKLVAQDMNGNSRKSKRARVKEPDT